MTLIGLTLFYNLTYGQNIVSNHDFEIIFSDSCKNSDGYISNYFKNKLKNWYLPSVSKPYIIQTKPFQDCYSMYFVENVGLLNIPKSGDVSIYVGFGRNGGQGRSYIANELNQEMDVGSIYHVTLFTRSHYRSGYNCNNLSIYFSEEMVYEKTMGILQYKPQLVYDKVILNTEWTKIEFLFKPSKPYQHIVIGNFHLSEENTYMAVEGNENESGTFVEIDEVSIVMVNRREYKELPLLKDH
ncbi:MAG: hypothetical protein OEW75_07020 [Cyclobacteriaceae bacterium]|nr:hypothetical protein [Cyclobacteriaceae bacterium]